MPEAFPAALAMQSPPALTGNVAPGCAMLVIVPGPVTGGRSASLSRLLDFRGNAEFDEHGGIERLDCNVQLFGSNLCGLAVDCPSNQLAALMRRRREDRL